MRIITEYSDLRLRKQLDKNQKRLDRKIAEDTSQAIPVKTGHLRRITDEAQKPGSGEVILATGRYGRAVYEKEPWFEKVKRERMKDWVRYAGKDL